MGVERLCQPKIEHLDGPVLAHLDIRGLQIPVDHPRLMRRFEGLGDLLRYWQRLVQGDRPLRDPVGEGRAFDQLQHQCPRPLGFLDAVDGGDVRVVEAGEDLGLPREPGEPIWISREGVGEDLQGDLAIELRVGGLPDLAHPALAEEGGDVVVPEAGAGGQSHELFESRNEPFYAEAVHRLQRVHRIVPETRTCAL